MNPFLNQKKSIVSVFNGGAVTLIPLHAVAPSDHHFEQVAAICNEKLVYWWCFRVLCMAEAYPVSLASEWFVWAKRGWEDDTHYVYVLMDEVGKIVGACGIKGSDLERAEIGYWCSRKHKGIMTNAVKCVLELAKRAGYQCLSATVHAENTRSLSLIRRCGFDLVQGELEVNGNLKFEVKFTDDSGFDGMG